MSTLKVKELEQIETAIKNAKGICIDKDQVLKIITEELKDLDMLNKFIVDTKDVSSLKNIYNNIVRL